MLLAFVQSFYHIVGKACEYLTGSCCSFPKQNVHHLPKSSHHENWSGPRVYPPLIYLFFNPAMLKLLCLFLRIYFKRDISFFVGIRHTI